MANNNELLFRQAAFDKLDARYLPRDLQWAAVLDGKVQQIIVDARASTDTPPVITPSQLHDPIPSSPITSQVPIAIAEQLSIPYIMSSSQVISQDSQGTTFVNATFVVSDQDNVDFELQVTRA